jgi:hypothetical protein
LGSGSRELQLTTASKQRNEQSMAEDISKLRRCKQVKLGWVTANFLSLLSAGITRAALILAASPIHSSNFNSASNRSNRCACPVASIPTCTLTCLRCRSRQKTLCLSIAVNQSPFSGIARLRIDIRYLLNAGVIIHSYDYHVRLLLPNLRSSMLQSLIAPR